MLDLPEILRANACTFEEHSWNFLLQKTKYNKVTAFYTTTDCTNKCIRVPVYKWWHANLNMFRNQCRRC